MGELSKKEINVKLSEDDLWNAYISIHNLTEGRYKNFYSPKYRDGHIKTKDKIKSIGIKKFRWVK